MSDPAKVYAKKYADLEAECERLRAALTYIAERHVRNMTAAESDQEIARRALDEIDGGRYCEALRQTLDNPAFAVAQGKLM